MDVADVGNNATDKGDCSDNGYDNKTVTGPPHYDKGPGSGPPQYEPG